MDINFDLYKIIKLPNGNILLKLKKDVDNTPYNLVLSDISFYQACKKNIGKINIYEPTNLTPQIINILMEQSAKIKSSDELISKINWIQDNLSAGKLNKENKTIIKDLKSQLSHYTDEIKDKIESYNKNNKTQIKKTTWQYLFIKLITSLTSDYNNFGEDFFLLKLLNQYHPEIKWDYKQIYMIETYNDIDMCMDEGERYYSLIQRLIKGDKKAFEGKEIKFFRSSFEINKANISDEIFPYIQDRIYNDGINWKDYDPINY